MLPDGAYTAVVDRLEDEQAVLEVAGEEDELRELILNTEELPLDGRHTNAILSVRVTDEALVETTYHPEETEQRQEDAQSRFDRLSRRPPDDETT